MKGKRFGRLWRLCLPFTALPLVGTALLYAGAAGNRPGDVNLDYVTDVEDAVLLARFIAEDKEAYISAEGIENADLNGDHLIGQKDLTEIMLRIAKLKFDAIARSTSTTEATAAPVTTTTETVQQDTMLTADGVSYPYNESVSVLTVNGENPETITVHYQCGDIIFKVFDRQPEHMYISISHQDNIVGYYFMCSEYSVPKGFNVTEYKDEVEPGSNGGLYAVLVLREDISINFADVSSDNRSDYLSKLAELNYYALNGVRKSRNPDMQLLDYHRDAAKSAAEHSENMAKLRLKCNMQEDHFGHDDYGNLIYYRMNDWHYGERLLANIGTDEDGVRINYQVTESGEPVIENGNMVILGKMDPSKGKMKPLTGYYPSNAGYRLDEKGIDWTSFTENIAFGYPETFSMLNSWVNSPTHRENVFTTKQTTVGIGFACTEDGKVYYGTQTFFK